MKLELKSWCQTHHAECLAQLAVFEPAREPLRQDTTVIPSLEAVAEAGLSAEARQFAQAALLALSDKELHHETEGQLHVMLSCESTHCPFTVGACKLLTPCLCFRRPMGSSADHRAAQRVAHWPWFSDVV